MKRRDRDLNPGGHMTIGLAVRRRTRLESDAVPGWAIPTYEKQYVKLYVKTH